MTRRMTAALAASGLWVIGSLSSAEVRAEPEEAGPQRQAAADAVLDEIVVTARRKEESLQDVPSAITAITANEIKKLNILQFADISEVAAGLQVNSGNISMRGVTYTVVSATPAPTTATYLNDAPINPAELATGLFDIGQIEVLRGPQGTLHGISTPSGAITLTTHKPDLTEFGASAEGTVGTHNENNVQAAFNAPLIPEKLAIRLAVLEDGNDADNIFGLQGSSSGTRSINSSASPFQETYAGRASVRYEPIDTFNANVMYEHFYIRTQNFNSAVFGSGSPGGVNPNAPAGYNGPVIGEKANLAVASGPNVGDVMIDNATGQLNWDLSDQRLSYVGSWQKRVADPQFAEGDPGNLIPGVEIQGARNYSVDTIVTHELRLSSVERIAGLLDYVVGAFHQRDGVETGGNNGAAAFLAGAFGPPGTVPSPVPPNTRYELDTLINTPRLIQETSAFANLTAHLGDKLEISAGGRHINSKVDQETQITTTPAYSAVVLPAAACGAVGGQFGVTYPGVCDVPVKAQNAIAPVRYTPHSGAWIYSGSISYHFTPDLMVYAQTGSSWREGPFTIGVNNASNDPTLNSLVNHTPEKSKSYEGGIKWSFLDHRARLNLAYYHQTFDGLIYTSPFAIQYLSYSGAGNPTVSTYPAFVTNVPATVDGIDFDFAADLTTNWNVTGNLSWADSRLNDASIPCNDGNFDGVPDTIVPTVASFRAAGKLVALCKSSAGASTAPKWNANIQSEYTLPVTATADAFIRGLLNYQPSNPNLNQGYVTPAYALLNLYLGMHEPGQKWEVSLFIKNVTDTNKVVTIAPAALLGPAGLSTVFGSTGYTNVSYTPRRQFGLNLRYLFGSG